MPADLQAYQKLVEELSSHQVTLVAVSKTKPISDIQALYEAGQRDFGENYVQELCDKHTQLPTDIRWHFIGHLQSNKVKYIAPFVHLIHGVDSESLLKEIDKQGRKNERVIDCLLQMHIAQEETKFGLNVLELNELLGKLSNYPNVRVVGLMGMASFSDNKELVRSEFRFLSQTYQTCQQLENSQLEQPFQVLSMGMSGDYQLAIEEGSNLLRIGSLLFGARG
ncbi:MAG: YggS family pyridoxal phosphate-dependent enzyme [Bacteroidota bacterium]|jgi:pyridoxal phosphate enzyme (YggS family)